jgi:hypothetical protein
MRRLSLWAAVLAAAASMACSHGPIQTGATPSTLKTPASTNALGYYIAGIPIEPARSAVVNADAPGYYIGGVRVDAPR